MGLKITVSNFKILIKEKISHVDKAKIPMAVIIEFTTLKVGSIKAVIAVENVQRKVILLMCFSE